MGTYDLFHGGPRHDPIFDTFYLCEVCGKDPSYDCTCPECPKCGVVGDPKCYELKGHLKKSIFKKIKEFLQK